MPTETESPVTAVKVEREFSLPGVAFCVASDIRSSEMFFGSSDFNVYRIDSAAEKPAAAKVSQQRHDSYVTGLVYRAGTLISAGYDGSIIWWDAETGDIRHRAVEAHEKWIRQLAISADGAMVASVGDDMKARLWNAETGDMIAEWGDYDTKTPNGYPSMLYAVTFSRDGKWLATGNKTGHVLVRNAQTGEIAARFETPVMYTWDPKARQHSIGGIRSLAFSSDGKFLAVGGMGEVGNIDHLGGNSRIEMFEWQSGERKFEIEDSTYKGLVERMEFGPDDAWLAAAGGDNGGFVSIYNCHDGKLFAQEKTPMHVHDFELSADGKNLCAVGHQKGCIVSLI